MLRRLIAVLCFALAAVLLALLAQQRTRHGIDHAAAAERAIWASGHTPWDWAPRQAQDVIAGRAFGDAVLHGDPRGLRIDSSTGEAYELGLRLPRALPLASLPRLRLASAANAPTLLRFVLAETVGAPLLVSAPIELPAADTRTSIDLRRLSWQRADGTVASLPTQAGMLRLRVHQPADSEFLVRGIDWLGANGHVPAEATIPRVTLPQGASAEALLALRDRIHRAWPLVRVSASSDITSATPRTSRAGSSAPGLLWCAGVIVLLILRWRGMRSRIFELLEIIAVTAPALIITIGLIDPSTAPRGSWLAVGTSMACAIALAWLAWPAQWQLWTSSVAAWATALLPLACAAAWAMSSTDKPEWPTPPHVLRYFGWALLQQALMLAVVAPRIAVRIRSRAACALAVGILFALMHTPNATLMVSCLAAEAWWAWSFLRHRALLPVAIAHAASALMLESALIGLPLRSLEVGARFLTM